MAKKKFSAGLTFVCCLLALVIGFAAAFFLYTYIKRPTGGDVYVSGDLSIHFMELGNKYAGDSIYIKAGDTDILIDAGSRESSTETTSAYIDQYCTDGVLEYVIATHADEYTDTPENQFPTQAMIDRVAQYTDRVYVTSLGDESAEDGYVSMNGNIVVKSGRGGVTVECSNNDTLLKDTQWFKENRTTPSAWLS